MHFEVPGSARLANVDRFLRETWLECCGHLSAFTIEGKEYLSDLGDENYDEDVEDMDVRVDAVLQRGSKFHHLYDFGTAPSSHSRSSRAAKHILGIANQTAWEKRTPSMPCAACGNVSVWVCPQCSVAAGGGIPYPEFGD
jgi:hypothetical protein